MRFQVSQVMDAIEQRLTTDVAGAQAVVDLGEIVRNVELDRGRSANLVRVGMVIDALGRYLVDDGALLYGVAERSLLSEPALTSKERMVLGRWTDQGLIEVTPTIGDRVVEVADLTGLPLIVTRPYPDLVKRFGWLADGDGRVLQLTFRAGVAALRPMDDPTGEPAGAPVTGSGPAVGRAKVPRPEPATAEPAESAPETESESEPESEPVRSLPLPVEVFGARGAARIARTRVSWRRFRRAEPSHPGLLLREWRCEGFECPAFGEQRRIGQPVPRMRGDVPVCPRHDEPVVAVGPRLPAYPVSIVVDDLPRRRLVVRGGQPVRIGRAVGDGAGDGSGDGAGDGAGDAGAEGDQPEELVSVARWLHEAAAARVSLVHLQLAAADDGLVVTDVSENGSIIWMRDRPDDPGTTRPLHGDTCTLGEWDSVELYTGIELVRGDRRVAAALGRDGLGSVLMDAPTAVHKQV
ncbi:MAG: hypothetical protein GEV12_06145 [Micromonosporaceae bacterium]|nr:hypothetical protein [Micromonosporaceae bacterium]